MLDGALWAGRYISQVEPFTGRVYYVTIARIEFDSGDVPSTTRLFDFWAAVSLTRQLFGARPATQRVPLLQRLADCQGGFG